jgi:O-antigen/teichoic acid export membrane protein
VNIEKKLASFKNSQGAMKYFRNTSWLLGEKILRMTLGLFVGVWVARYLGPEQFGLFSYAQSFVALFAAFATLGLDGIVVRELLKDESQRDKLLGTAFILKLLGAFVVLSLLAVAVFFQSNDYQTNSLIFIVGSATVFQSFNVIDFYFQSKVLSKYVVYSNVASFFLSSIIKVILIFNEAPLIYFAYVILFDNLVLACGFIYFYFDNKLSIFNWSYDKHKAKSLLKDSWPLILTGIAVSIYMKIDQIMIKEMLSTAEVGYYAAAVRLSEAWYFVPVVISTSLFPAILNAKKNNIKLYYLRLQNLFDLMVVMSLIVALLVMFLSDWIVILLFGTDYAAASTVLTIHIWAGLFVSLGLCRGKWILAENLQKYTVLFLGGGLIFNVFFNYLFIPKFGINGAAYSTLISQGIGTLVIPFFFKKTRLSFIMMIKAIFLFSIVSRCIK